MTARYPVGSCLRYRDFVRSVSLVSIIFVYAVVHGENDVSHSTVTRPIQSKKDAESLTWAQSKARELSSVGAESRRHVPDPSVYPYSAVGLLRSNASTCTATLVASTIVVTAAECVLDSDGEVRDSSYSSFSVTLLQGANTMTASVARVHKQSDYWKKWPHNAYVLVELDAALGDANAALLLPSATNFARDDPMNVQLVGYGCNNEPGECFQPCSIQFPRDLNDPEYMLHHDCDVSAKLLLGSPMLIRSTAMDTYIVGIYANSIGHDADDDDDDDDVMVDHSAFHQGVLGSFIQPHLVSVVQQAQGVALSSFSTSSSSSSSFDDELNSESSTPGKENQIDGTPVDSSTSSTETSVTSSQTGIAPTAAYTCIGLVSAAWLVIIVSVVRKIRAHHR